MATKLEGRGPGGKALVAGPLKKTDIFFAAYLCATCSEVPSNTRAMIAACILCKEKLRAEISFAKSLEESQTEH